LSGGRDHRHPRFPDHHGDAADEDPGGQSLAWDLDNVELTSVGVDVGSSTSHLLFSRLHLQRLAQSLSSRFVVVRRQVLHRSPILLTPFGDGGLIDAGALGAFVRDAYREAGLERDDVDTGAVILTGVALERRNARRVAELFSAEGGRFVCASAGHNLEAILAAHGSGAVRLSAEQPDQVVLHIDVGGGTSKLALVRAGAVLATAAVAAGGRLVVLSEAGEVLRAEAAAAVYACRLGLRVAPGARLDAGQRDRLAAAMAEALAAAAAGGRDPDLLLTPPLESGGLRPTVLTFSGGVAEYLHGRERRRFDDLAPELAEAIRSAAAAGRLPGAAVELAEGIRATVIGASQFTVQLSGSTVHVSDGGLLPLRNLPVVDARLAGAAAADPDAVSGAVARALRRLDLAEGEAPLAVALRWDGEPRYARLRGAAAGLAAALPRSLAGGVPVVLALNADVGRSLGAILSEEFSPRARLASLDGLDLRELDYLDVGEVIRPAGVVPVVIKSLAFPA
jgi:ethanolamine utilization protein EutA